jgi:PKD domain-containing protein
MVFGYNEESSCSSDEEINNENNIESNNEIQDINNNVETTETIYDITSNCELTAFLDPPDTTPPQSQIWFTPNVGSVDMLDLFNQPEQWDSARSKIDVFKFYTGQVGSAGWSCTVNPSSNCGENHLQNFVDVQAFSKLGDWGIDIAIESFFAGPIMSVDPIECSTSEYVYSLSLDGSINVIQSVQSNGGTVRYLAMDEPIRQWYPQYYYIYTGQTDPRPCLTDSLGELADHVAAYILQMQEWFPSVSIGHIELYPEVGVEQLKEWVIALEARGVSLSFLHIDVHGPRVDQYISFGMNIDVAADMAELKSFLNAHDIEFGIIFFDTYYDSQYWEPSEYNDSTYYTGTMNWVNFVHDANLKPDHSIFQSWVFPYYTTGIGPNEIPVNLPEDDPTVYSHTRLINEALGILESNAPPEKPETPSGSSSGKAGEQYTYTCTATDPDGDQLHYLFDWGDGSDSGWIGPINSGDIVTASHTWAEKTDYEIKVKAKDTHGEESPWSDPLPITMPKNKAINPFLLFLERFMERFPILEQILQLIYVYLG